jgi:phosphotriesterase-related protein|eukprot:COSAG06_NODE_13497_length_1251_cov_1.774306_2_plen_259_part_00
MSSLRPDWYGLPTEAAWSPAEAAADGDEDGTDWSMEGLAQAVTGPLDPALLGAVMMQEHLLVDLSTVNVPQSVAGPTGEHFWKLPCESLEVSGGLRFYSLMNEEDSAMLDIDEAIEGVQLYKQHGGGTLVSPTGNEIGRDPHGMRRISLATGVPVIMGTAHYLGAAQDGESMQAVSVEDIAAEFISDIQQGVVVHQGNPMHRDGGWGVPSGIRAGIIGELGCSHPLLDGERKALQAAALAQVTDRQTLLSFRFPCEKQ